MMPTMTITSTSSMRVTPSIRWRSGRIRRITEPITLQADAHPSRDMRRRDRYQQHLIDSETKGSTGVGYGYRNRIIRELGDRCVGRCSDVGIRLSRPHAEAVVVVHVVEARVRIPRIGIGRWLVGTNALRYRGRSGVRRRVNRRVIGITIRERLELDFLEHG